MWQAGLPLSSTRPARPWPNLRLTYKVAGKSVSESLPTPAAIHKAEHEIAEFRRFQQLSREFIDTLLSHK